LDLLQQRRYWRTDRQAVEYFPGCIYSAKIGAAISSFRLKVLTRAKYT
jgi:hypothetical protein